MIHRKEQTVKSVYSETQAQTNKLLNQSYFIFKHKGTNNCELLIDILNGPVSQPDVSGLTLFMVRIFANINISQTHPSHYESITSG